MTPETQFAVEARALLGVSLEAAEGMSSAPPISS
ncbi:MAG: hypothetical protein ACI9K5_001395, partial [Gammaproteobacteria bacterium]